MDVSVYAVSFSMRNVCCPSALVLLERGLVLGQLSLLLVNTQGCCLGLSPRPAQMCISVLHLMRCDLSGNWCVPACATALSSTLQPSAVAALPPA